MLACSTSGRGFRSRGLLAALGSCKKSCSSCFADASERGVNPRLEVGGSACVAPALRSRGCGCFCLRLDFQVAVSVTGAVKGVNPGFLVLAFSTRTLKSSGVPGRRVQAWGFCVSMSPLACSTPAYSRMSGVLGRRAFSCGPPLLLFGELLSSQDLLVVKLSPLCWLAASGERGAGGAF